MEAASVPWLYVLVATSVVGYVAFVLFRGLFRLEGARVGRDQRCTVCGDTRPRDGECPTCGAAGSLEKDPRHAAEFNDWLDGDEERVANASDWLEPDDRD